MSTQTGADVDVVEHLDFEPPCSGPACDLVAVWVLRVTHGADAVACGTFLACDSHKAYNERRIAQAVALRRGIECKPHAIRSTVTWEAL